jgi:2-dehydropantoate 2-reductase
MSWTVLVLAAGALGSLLGGKLSRVAPVQFLGRAAHLDAIRTAGLRLAGLSREVLHPGPGLALAETMQELSPPRAGAVVLLTVKAGATAAAAAELAAAYKRRWPRRRFPTLFTFQNGMGWEAALRKVWPGMVIHAVSHLGATMVGPGMVEDWGGEILLPRGGVAERLRRLLRRAGISARTAGDRAALERRRWEKFAFNCALNALATLLEKPNHKALELRWRSLQRAVLAEVRAEASEAGVRLPGIAALGAEFERRVRASRNLNSMLQDLRAGRPTETAFLNREVAERAKSGRRSAPANVALAGWIERLEAAKDAAERAAVRSRGLEELARLFPAGRREDR